MDNNWTKWIIINKIYLNIYNYNLKIINIKINDVNESNR